ncbi:MULTISPECIES: hypothetical protein [unclassified Bacteroides]|uniref:hypothetical protein n=1 Tax=unclassified Bacteroides TaxID=2646097 RepID=UPI000E8AB85D|nr:MULTISPECIES: hypothetical protein [unclassified Bacteroides]RGN43840.1 hypothetical protein DXB63_15215 [Bacteroides sp. OM05-12]RHR73864.1 hypothetical protein DWW69_14380 [Bacteroides sp. AF16-49]
MITTKINVTPYLAEYIKSKFNCLSDEPLKIPDAEDLYHVIWKLMVKRPDGISPIDTGNLAIILPERRVGKDPMYYNYLSPRSQNIIEKYISRHFNNELHQMLEENEQNGRPLNNIDVVHQFMCVYNIDSITEDALLKNYYRWRDLVRRKDRRREYKRRYK